MNYFWAFVIGGGICAAGQILIDLTGLTPARILTGYVVAGVVLSALGWYAPLAELAGCGATVPLLGFGPCWPKASAPHCRRRGPSASSPAGSPPLPPASPPASSAAWSAPGSAGATTRTSPR